MSEMSATLLLKASLLWTLALLAAHLLRKASPGSRHRLWSLAFAALLALPLLAPILPALRLPVLVPVPDAQIVDRQASSTSTSSFVPPDRARPAGARHETLDDARDATVTPTAALPATPASRASAAQRIASLDRLSFASLVAPLPLAKAVRPTRPAWPAWLPIHVAATALTAIWLTGAICAVATLTLSLFRVRRLARRAETIEDPAWRDTADTLAARLALRRPVRLLLCDGIGTPMAGGVWRPTVFLPASARGWDAEQRDVVLAHEIAHLAGRDPLRHLAARLALAVYWFHPLAWMAARRATVAREQACDETVLALGTRPSAYARVLLDLADALHPSAPAALALGALPMVERSLLETRLMAILDDNLRPTTRRRILMPAVGVALLTLSVAAVRPVARTADSTDMDVLPRTTATDDPIEPPSAQDRSAQARDANAARESAARESTERASNAALDASHASHARDASGTDTTDSTDATASTLSPLAAPATAQADVDRDSACAWDLSRGRSFRGNMWTSDVGGRTVIREQVGVSGTTRIIQKALGDVRVCMIAEDAPINLESERGYDPSDRPSQWIGRVGRVTMESRRGGAVQRLTIAGTGSSQRVSWRVGDAERAFDGTAQQWRDRMLAALDATWELAMLRGQVSSLRGEISSIRGEESSLRGEISSLRGEVSSLRGEISSALGAASSLQGEISSINGHVSSLRGEISSERGAIAGIRAAEYRATQAERDHLAARIKRHEDQIAQIERAIRDYNAPARIAEVERTIATLNTKGKVAELEEQIRKFDLAAKEAALERRIVELDVNGKVAAIERQIAALDADRRGRQLEERLDAELKRLESAIAAIR